MRFVLQTPDNQIL